MKSPSTPRWRPIRLALTALVLPLALAAGLAALAPATWLDYGLQSASRGALMLGNAEGRIWQGKGTLQAILPHGEAITLAPVSWRIALGELLAGRLLLTMHSEQTDKPLLNATLSRKNIQLHAVRLELPAALLGVVSPTLREADLSGSLVVSADDAKLENGAMTGGKIDILWNNAASNLTTVRPLGSYSLTITSKTRDQIGDKDGGISFKLSTLSGDLNLQGSGEWHTGKRLNFDGAATPSEAKRQELAPLLRILGKEITPGVYKLQLDPSVGAV